MKGYLVVNKFLINDRFSILYEKLVNAFLRENIRLMLITNDKIKASIDSCIKLDCDFIIFWDKDILLAKLLEKNGYKLFNSSDTIAICDDKGLMALELKNIVHMPKTILLPFTYDKVGYNDLSFIDDYDITYPVVLKTNKGSFGTGVYLLNNKRELLKTIKENENVQMLLQEYIEESYGVDIRVMVIFGKAIGAVKRINKNDFRSNVLKGGKMEPYLLDDKLINYASKVSQKLNLSFGSVDFLVKNEEKEEYLLCEVNSNAHFNTFSNTTGIDFALELARGIKKKIYQ